jgi:hypothetical protein
MNSSAARALTHGLSNDVAIALGNLELLLADGDLAPEARALTEAALLALIQASDRLAAYDQAARSELPADTPTPVVRPAGISEH